MSKIGIDTSHAALLLSQGNLVAIPTETVYGLAANAFNASAVATIFEVKNRPAFDPLIVHVSGIDMASRLSTAFPAKAHILAQLFWPGPLTLVLPKADTIPDLVSSGMPTVALRVPQHPLALQLLNKIDFPLAAPSANPFGYVSPTTAQHVATQLGDKLSYILDGGPCTVGLESTIVAFDGDEPTVLRMGGLAIEEIEAAIGRVKVKTQSSSNPQAPGMLLSHYATRTPIVFGELKALVSSHTGKHFGVLALRDTLAYPGIALSPSGNLAEAAQNLFAAMRSLDTDGYELIVAEKMPDTGLGRAINDRLLRASHCS